MLQYMGSERGDQDLVTEQQQNSYVARRARILWARVPPNSFPGKEALVQQTQILFVTRGRASYVSRSSKLGSLTERGT